MAEDKQSFWEKHGVPITNSVAVTVILGLLAIVCTWLLAPAGWLLCRFVGVYETDAWWLATISIFGLLGFVGLIVKLISLRTKPLGQSLGSDELEALKWFVKHGGKELTAPMLAHGIDITALEAETLCDNLEEKGYLGSCYDGDIELYMYSLTQRAKLFLYQAGHLKATDNK